MKTIKNLLLAMVLWFFLFATACFAQTNDTIIGSNNLLSQGTLSTGTLYFKDYPGLSFSTSPAYAISYRLDIKQSTKRYATNFKIVNRGRNYYTNSLIIKGDEFIRFLVFYRSGGFKSYCFRADEIEIYKSK